MSNTLCPLPWMHLSQRNNGHYRVCCNSNPAIDKGLLRSNSGEFFHASTSKISDVRNSDTLKDIRKAMVTGKWHAQCSQCRMEEQSGLRSPRMNELERWEKKWDQSTALSLTGSDGAISIEANPLMSYDIRLGNVCNLKCRMCGPMDSRAWYADYQKLYNIQHFSDTQGSVIFTDQNKNDPYLWFENKFFWEQLFIQKENIRSLYLVGGEPLLIDEHFLFLERLVNSGVSKNIELVYNSNLTRLNGAMITLWRHFREVNIGVSIDGIFAVNDYIRAPSDFQQIKNNITMLDCAGGNIHMWLAPTLQIYNIWHIPEFLRWIIKRNFDFLKNPTFTGLVLFHPLHRPTHFNIQTLPLSVKAMIEDDYELLFSELLDNTNPLLAESIAKTIKYLRGILQYMNTVDSSHLLPEFLRHTEDLDKIRQQKFSSVCPELHIMLQDKPVILSAGEAPPIQRQKGAPPSFVAKMR